MPFPTTEIKYNSYQSSHLSDTIKTNFGTGNSRVRKIIDRNEDTVSVTSLVDADGLNAFNIFYYQELNNGEEEFQGPYHVGIDQKTGTLQIVDGTYSVRRLSGDIYEISYSFRIIDRDMTDEDAVYDAVILNGGFPLP
jgi:hypothetical protein